MMAIAIGETKGRTILKRTYFLLEALNTMNHFLRSYGEIQNPHTCTWSAPANIIEAQMETGGCTTYLCHSATKISKLGGADIGKA